MLLAKLLDAWSEEDLESDSAHRERRWRENTAKQAEQLVIDTLLESVAHKRNERPPPAPPTPRII